MNFQSHIVKIENGLRLGRMRNLTIDQKAFVFKSLAILKIVHLSLITTVAHTVINELNITHKKIYMKRKKL